MTYLPPKDLAQRAKKVRSKYKRSNPARLELINILESANAYIEQAPANSDNTPEDLEQIALAPWIIGLESIGSTSWHRDPGYKKGYFWGWGSTLFSIYLEELGITESQQIDDQQKFICLEKFYNFILKNQQSPALSALLKDRNLSIEAIKAQAKINIQTLLIRLSADITGILGSIPTEGALDTKMSALYNNYQTEKANAELSIFNWSKTENKERIFLAQLAEAFAHILPASPDEKDATEKTMTRSQRIKMGLLLYILQIINNEYYLRSPKKNSVLFNLCCKTLNLEHFKNINGHTKLTCISAFKNYFNDNNVLAAVEDYGKKNFGDKNLLNEIDVKKTQMDIALTKITSKLLGADNAKPSWTATRTLGQVGALLMASPGYGMGYVLGYSASDTHTAVSPKLSLSNCISYIGTTFLGFTRVGFGFLAADFIVQSTLTRAFAKVLEQMGMLVGYATGGAIGLSIDLSYQGLQHICKAFLHLYDQLYDPVLMKNVNPEVVRSLMRLPPEIFADDKRAKLETIATDNGIKPTQAEQATCAVLH